MRGGFDARVKPAPSATLGSRDSSGTVTSLCYMLPHLLTLPLACVLETCSVDSGQLER